MSRGVALQRSREREKEGDDSGDCSGFARSKMKIKEKRHPSDVDAYADRENSQTRKSAKMGADGLFYVGEFNCGTI